MESRVLGGSFASADYEYQFWPQIGSFMEGFNPQCLPAGVVNDFAHKRYRADD
jgi:hypothetical protein